MDRRTHLLLLLPLAAPLLVAAPPPDALETDIAIGGERVSVMEGTDPDDGETAWLYRYVAATVHGHVRHRAESGLTWWLSENGVVLTEGPVPLRYVAEVRGRRQGVGVLWKDGVKVDDLPKGVVARVPSGKEGRGGSEGEVDSVVFSRGLRVWSMVGYFCSMSLIRCFARTSFFARRSRASMLLLYEGG